MMHTWLLMVMLSTGPYSVHFEVKEDCVASGNALVDAYPGTQGYCIKVVNI
jgi:hypothetical protein